MKREFLFAPLTMLLALSAYTTYTSTYQLFYFFGLSANFVVVSTRSVCEKPLNNRCVTHYITRNSNGTAGDIVPFGYEFASDALEPGSRVVKHGNSLYNDINGKQELWRYLWQHIVISLSGAVGLLLWYFSGGLNVLSWWLRDVLHTQKA